jgi:hypothetical protein
MLTSVNGNRLPPAVPEEPDSLLEGSRMSSYWRLVIQSDMRWSTKRNGSNNVVAVTSCPAPVRLTAYLLIRRIEFSNNLIPAAQPHVDRIGAVEPRTAPAQLVSSRKLLVAAALYMTEFWKQFTNRKSVAYTLSVEGYSISPCRESGCGSVGGG